jgi:hypothetical protein
MKILLFILIITLCIHNVINGTNNVCFRARGCGKIIEKINLIKPIETKLDILDKPLIDFYINSSHNTYLPNTQNFDIASTSAVYNALIKGARFIEFDCYGINSEPIITHMFTTTFIYFTNCIDVISKFKTSDPIILYLELNCNNITQQKIKKIIIDKIGNRLLNKFNKQKFDKIPIKYLLNKIIIIASGNIYINDIIDGIMDKDIINNNHYITNKSKNILKRVYPAGDLYGHLSYNFDPIDFWNNGYNFVSLNFQTDDKNFKKNEIMFKDYSFILKYNI